MAAPTPTVTVSARIAPQVAEQFREQSRRLRVTPSTAVRMMIEGAVAAEREAASSQAASICWPVGRQM